ncbi:MAG: DUF3570 domain-containing protein [Saprospiraceae bacterium]|nr:DUF3570 domain-containing protein [Saprospiraceae bacterium]
MLKRNVVFGFLMSWLSSFAQRPDSSFVKRKPSKTDIAVVYAHYVQDGQHSAVTGGQGTERLQVYAPDLTISQQRDSIHRFTLNAGVDVVSSASTDRIDFVRSSASSKDTRMHLNLGYARPVGVQGWSTGVGLSGSAESDYLSVGGSISAERALPGANRRYGLRLDLFFDDLRWGRFNSDYRRPVRLVYPSELRGQQWFTAYRRQSYNLQAHFEQVINRRLNLGIYPGLSLQHGLLSTPFHRVYFNDTSATVRVENLPQRRIRFALGTQANAFLADRYILRSLYRFYADNFGILSHTVELECPVKITPQWSLGPVLRWYTQTGARYFKPYGEHAPEQRFYTSDYDLSAVQSYELGAALRLAPFRHLTRRLTFNTLQLRYIWYRRSDGLQAHMLTLRLEGVFE